MPEMTENIDKKREESCEPEAGSADFDTKENAGKQANGDEAVENETFSATCDKESEGLKKELGAVKKELNELKKAADEQKKAADELTDRYTRMMAEYDNFRKRAQKEREGIYSDAFADALKDILPIKDTLELAMNYADDSKLAEGVKMTLNKFDEALKRMGVEEFGASGEAFDPTLHNAVMHIEDETLGESVIAEVFTKGCRKGDKIIRFAMVKVAN